MTISRSARSSPICSVNWLLALSSGSHPYRRHALRRAALRLDALLLLVVSSALIHRGSLYIDGYTRHLAWSAFPASPIFSFILITVAPSAHDGLQGPLHDGSQAASERLYLLDKCAISTVRPSVRLKTCRGNIPSMIFYVTSSPS